MRVDFAQTKLSPRISRMASVLGAVGFSAIALTTAVKPAAAADVKAGTDYVWTPAGGTTKLNLTNPYLVNGGAALPFSGPATIHLKGLPIDPALGLTDTIVKRLNDVTAVPAVSSLPSPDLPDPLPNPPFENGPNVLPPDSPGAGILGRIAPDFNNDGIPDPPWGISPTNPWGQPGYPAPYNPAYTTPMEFTRLSLKSENPYSGLFDVYIGLQSYVDSTPGTPGNISGGLISIAHSPNDTSPGGIWSSQFIIKGLGVVTPTGTYTPAQEKGIDFVKKLIQTTCVPGATTCFGFDKILKLENDPWTHAPNPDSLVVPPGSAIANTYGATSNFFLQSGDIKHDAGDGSIHTVRGSVIPTPAMLPGLISMGIAAWRKRKAEQLESETEQS